MTTHRLDPIDTDRSVSIPSALPARVGLLLFGVGSYLVGVVALVAAILASLGVLPFTGGPVHLAHPLAAALFNLGLLVAFGVQHSVMARAAFKRRWTRIIHPAMERPAFVLATGLVLLPLVVLWQPLPQVLWSVGAPLARAAIYAVSLLGWAYLFLATFAIDHFELFGLQQSWRGFRGLPPEPVPFRERWMYRFDRHPIMTGLLVGLWATPDMTVGHLLFVAGFSAYVVVGVSFEERALRRQWRGTYEGYSRRVGSLVPVVHGRSGNAAPAGIEVETTIAAPPERIWPRLSDVRRWPEWLQTVTAVEPLGAEALAVGGRYRITQPRLRPAVWEVVHLEPRRSFSWQSRTPGVRTLADHTLTPLPDGTTRVTLRVRFSGPLAFLARALAGRLTRDYMTREAARLKELAEAR